jgi:hypothetical protein
VIENLPIKLAYFFSGSLVGIVITAGYYQRYIALAYHELQEISARITRLRRMGMWK